MQQGSIDLHPPGIFLELRVLLAFHHNVVRNQLIYHEEFFHPSPKKRSVREYRAHDTLTLLHPHHSIVDLSNVSQYEGATRHSYEYKEIYSTKVQTLMN